MAKRISIIALALFFVLGVFPFTVSAAEDNTLNVSSLDRDYKVYDPIPLLVVVISFDADGDGEDALSAGKSTISKTSEAYGEQWAYSPESHWAQICFGETGKTMNNFYKWLSNDKFYWVPVEETYGEANNGVVYVTVNQKHPHAIAGSNQSVYGNERYSALREAGKYVDYAKYDKNSDGYIDYTEISFAFIIAGYNSKYGTSGSGFGKQKWGENCFEVSTSSGYVEVDGVKMLNGSRNGRFVYMGEYQSLNKPIMFGTIAHELGHVLGAVDLYTYSGYTWCGGPGENALMGGGSGNHYGSEQSGTSPAAHDPYYLIDYGFQDYTVVTGDGEYTLYSRDSSEGDYNIIRINTYSEKEYYLIENRYLKDTSKYDAIDSACKCIMIWHVDENIMHSTNLPNCYKSAPHAPGLTPLYNNRQVGGANGSAWNKGEVFNCRDYSFAGTQTWYSSMDDEDAENFNLQIEILSDPSGEMKIKVTGAPHIGPYVSASCPNNSINSVTIKGTIVNLNAGTLTQFVGNLYSDANHTKLIESKNIEINPDGSYTVVFENLAEDKTFYYEIVATSTEGVSVKSNKAFTASSKNVRTDSYLVYLNGIPYRSRPFEVEVKFGEVLTYSVPMNKTGYVFCGWYYDEAFTQKYEMTTKKDNTDPVYLYARFIPESDAVTLKVVGATVTSTVFGIEAGETFEEIEIAEKPGYTFVGWFSDPDFNTGFSFYDPVLEPGTCTIYALWEDNNPVQTTASETTEETTTVSTESTTTTPSGENKGMSPVVIVIIVVAAVAVVAVVVILVIKKRKK